MPSTSQRREKLVRHALKTCSTSGPVGVIGLGAMGAGMAANLRRAGHPLRVYDVVPARAQALVGVGGVVCASALELAVRCEVLVSVLPTAVETEDLLFGSPNGCLTGMQAGNLFIMCSTVDPDFSAQLESRLAERGVLYLEAPLLGNAALADTGELSLMVSGRQAAFDKAEPYLQAMASRVYRLGLQAGAANQVKIIQQLLLGVHLAAAAEASALGQHAGVDPQALHEVISHSRSGSWIFDLRLDRVPDLADLPLSTLDRFAEDLGLLLAMARQRKVALPLSSTAHQLFLQASQKGHRDQGGADARRPSPSPGS